MSDRQIGVGIIGIQPGRSWGAVAHVPALRQLTDLFHIAGIANTSAQSGRSAAAALDIGHAFDSVSELIASPAVQLVAICVKVPHHAEIARAAVGAGKHIYCEWPLARTLDEAEELEDKAQRAGIINAVGTQAIFSPAVVQLTKMISEGALGHVLSSTIVGSGMTWGEEIEQRNEYLLDASNGATMLTIAAGHALSAVQHALDPIKTVSAQLATRRKTVRISESGQNKVMSGPDQVLLACTLADGLPLSLHYRGGLPRGRGFVWQIDGTNASARVTAKSGLIEMTGLTLSLSNGASGQWTEIVGPVEQPVVDGVRRLYQAIWQRITSGKADFPTFSDAVRLHRLIATIERAAETGKRQNVED